MSLDPLRVASQRPGSSHSNRSISRTSQRPVSRFSQRTITKRPHLAALLNILVKQVTGLNEYDTQHIQEVVDVVSKRIDQMKQAAVPDSSQIDAHVRGHVQKARINVQDALADVMHAKYAELKFIAAQRRDLDQEIKSSTLPSHVHFLLLLSSPPTTTTLSQAQRMLERKNDSVPSSPTLTWGQILVEEPFEGQHWQGAYGLPKESTVERWEQESSDSTVSSILDAFDFEEDSPSVFEEDQIRHSPLISVQERFPQAPKVGGGREIVEALQAKQYWQPGWQTDAVLCQAFDRGDASTLGPTFSHILRQDQTSFVAPEQEAFINELDALREVFMLLQGRQSCLFEIGPDLNIHEVTGLRYRVVHLTPASQASILASFACHASTLNPLRDLVRRVQNNATSSTLPFIGSCRTFEAFATAIEHQLLLFDHWCAGREEHISRAQRGGCACDQVVSLLSLEKDVDARLARTFKILLEIYLSFQSKLERLPPSTLTALILNALLEAVHSRIAIGDATTARSLMDVWQESAEPMWANLGRWLTDGIPISVGFEGDIYEAKPTWDDKEFFIRTNPLVDLGSPDFWEAGYTLLSCHNLISNNSSGEGDRTENGLPTFLHLVAQDILAAGKAIGLLRALDMIHLVGDDWQAGWVKFKTLTNAFSPRGLDATLEALMSDILLPSCQLAQSRLRDVLVDECDIWRHVAGFENVYLMMRGDSMSQFGEKVFTRMDTRQPWNDFHFLNTAFRDVSKAGGSSWINATLVRIAHRGNKDRSIKRTVRAIDGLFIEYAVPFPLTYIFGPEMNVNYSSLFCFLLQIRRSKSILDRILIRGLNGSVPDYEMPDLKVFYTLRSKLSWFVNTFWTFIMTNVIHVNLLEFHEALHQAGSLDEIISSHRVHIEKLLGRCLLQPNTSALHQAILSILDIGLQFSDCLSAFAGDTSLDVSRRSLVAMRQRHRRRCRDGRSRKSDVIGFAEALLFSEDSSDSESDLGTPSISTEAASISFVEESCFTRLQKMGLELDGLVRFVRRGVESMASGVGDAAPTFRILAFCLEGWDL